MTPPARSTQPRADLPAPASVIWQEVEYGSYAADLPLCGELAATTEGPVLELGCGIGRVALRLAESGHEVWGIDVDGDRLRELDRTASEAGLSVRTVRADARRFSLPRSFGLILAPMQLAELLGGSGCREMLHSAARHLAPGGRLAVTLLGLASLPPLTDRGGGSALPDVRQRDGWVFSSLPLRLARDGDVLVAERMRQTVSPAGDLDEQLEVVELELLAFDRVEAMAAEAGLRPSGRRTIRATTDHVGSTVVVLESETGVEQSSEAATARRLAGQAAKPPQGDHE